MASPATEEEDTGKRNKKKHNKCHRQPQQQDEAEAVVEASPPKKKKQEKQRKVHGGLAGRSGQGPGSTQIPVKNSVKQWNRHHPKPIVLIKNKSPWIFFSILSVNLLG